VNKPIHVSGFDLVQISKSDTTGHSVYLLNKTARKMIEIATKVFHLRH
jgi:hypothetical protein